MSLNLDIARLEKVRRVGDKTKARCPACAEQGMDKTGAHLFIAPDGRFGCVLHPGPDGHAHRQRIFALVGIAKGGKTTPRKPITYRVQVIPASREGGKVIYGRHGHPFSTYAHTREEDALSEDASQTSYREGTGKRVSVPSVGPIPEPSAYPNPEEPPQNPDSFYETT